MSASVLPDSPIPIIWFAFVHFVEDNIKTVTYLSCDGGLKFSIGVTKRFPFNFQTLAWPEALFDYSTIGTTSLLGDCK